MRMQIRSLSFLYSKSKSENISPKIVWKFSGKKDQKII